MSTARLFVMAVCVLVLGACKLTEPPTASVRHLTILYTNDEHGWMAGMREGRGAASLLQQWRDKEGFREDGPFLVLSGGDNWTGPAISTLSKGESMVQVMNAMRYDAAAVGNHEFDFGLENLRRRALQANYAYLSANIRWRATGERPVDLGILPYSLEVVNGIRIAVIGLTTTETPTATLPTAVRPLRFHAYEPALRETFDQAQTLDPDLTIVIGHVCMNELFPLAKAIADLDIAVLGGGHCNELVAEKVGNSIVLGGGYHFSSYARAELTVDINSKRVLEQSFSTEQNRAKGSDARVAAVVARWQAQQAGDLSRVLAYVDRDYDRTGEALRQAIVRSWLEFDTTADVALTNAGGLRAPLRAGEVTVSDVFDIMPFDNTIVAVEVTGASLRQALANGSRPVFAGTYQRGGVWFVGDDGVPLQDDARYRVLINSFMYEGGDGYESLRQSDPDGFDMGVAYRAPFARWLEAQASSETAPLSLEP